MNLANDSNKSNAQLSSASYKGLVDFKLAPRRFLGCISVYLGVEWQKREQASSVKKKGKKETMIYLYVKAHIPHEKVLQFQNHAIMYVHGHATFPACLGSI